MKTEYARILREQVFPRVQKPARYIGGEWNQVNKNPQSVKTRMVLAFPDVYEIGISYLGFHILYELLNQEPDIYVERVYSPWVDAEQILRERKILLCSLETSTPLAAFHLVGVTLQHEMSYTNVLNLLDLGHIPIHARQRKDQDPLVLGGGPCAANPEPIAELFDLILLGDGEQVVKEVITRDQSLRQLDRAVRIRQLAQIPGVYAPAGYRPHYSRQGTLERIESEPGLPFPVKRRIEPAPALPQKPLVPYLGVPHDRVSAELFRGCVRGCRFCQAGMITRPVRERDPQAVMEQMLQAIQETGYEEVSVTSLSSGDYTQLLPLLRCLMQNLSEQQVALSFPSLRLDSFRRELAEIVQMVRKTGLTFAPEAGSPRLRQVINKYLHEEELITNLSQVFAEGWDLIKLYFMIGLPTETREDVHEINRLVRRILNEARKIMSRRRGPRINLSINLFVPKPHTPFQWEGQLPRIEAKARLKELAQVLPRAAGFAFSKRNEAELDRSYLEAVLARGDRRLWPVVYRAWSLGARFDSWGDQFRFDLWEQAFRESEIDPDNYALRERSMDEVLPWQHLDMGVHAEYLKKERNRSRAELLTPDCRQANICNCCGVADPKSCPLPPAPNLALSNKPVKPKSRPEREAVRIRLGYRKTGDMRFVGHLDMVNLFRRAARRARLPLHYSLGFHPQPSLAFGPPLPLGFVGLAEWMDLGLDTWVDPREVQSVLNGKLPVGIRIEAAREIPLRTPALNEQIKVSEYLITFPNSPGFQEYMEERVQALVAADEVLGTQWSKRGPIQVNLRPSVIKLELMSNEASYIAIRLLHSTELPRPAKVTTIIDYLRGQKIAAAEVICTRTASGKLFDGRILIP